jgi:hypothetical protein
LQVGANSVFCGQERWQDDGGSAGIGCRIEAPRLGVGLQCGIYRGFDPAFRTDLVGCFNVHGVGPVDNAGCIHYLVAADVGAVTIIICYVAGHEVDCWDYANPSYPDYCLLYLGPKHYCYIWLADPAGSLADCVGAPGLRRRAPATATARAMAARAGVRAIPERAGAGRRYGVVRR